MNLKALSTFFWDLTKISYPSAAVIRNEKQPVFCVKRFLFTVTQRALDKKLSSFEKLFLKFKISLIEISKCYKCRLNPRVHDLGRVTYSWSFLAVLVHFGSS